MRIFGWRKILAPVLLSVLLLVTACGGQQSRFDPPPKGPAVVRESASGGSFNKYFPAGGGGYERVYTQEKKGAAIAKLKKGGKDVAELSITDTVNTPDTRAKFKQSTQRIAGYPAATQGSTMTSILVADRFQVKVRSLDPSFSPSDREAWLQKFNLSGIASLK
ncbi:hypothetical protein [Kamptonema formosum]|uniref:hypothetical protein n=1 Tax=Kamptonema formosum TaxID=331992 RepID=UPI0003462539|nr:hypothetical protein [Oscillatoria sp. PCC 10802]